MSEYKEGFIAKLQEVEDWLYEDGEDETKGVYIAKLEELKKVPLLLHFLVYIVSLCVGLVCSWTLSFDMPELF